jgi:quercetin dioxygenase-like cupin family protein
VRCLVSSWRRSPDSTIPLRAKITGSYVGPALAKTEAAQAGFDEALLLTVDGSLAEATTSNVFLRRGSVWATPSADQDILEGITRREVMELIGGELGEQVVERGVDRSELYVCDEAFPLRHRRRDRAPGRGRSPPHRPWPPRRADASPDRCPGGNRTAGHRCAHGLDDARLAMSPFADLAELTPVQVWDGVAGRILGGERVTVAVLELDPGSVVPEHSHEHEQIGVCLTGSLDFRAGEEERELGPGGSWRIAGGVLHEVRTGPEGAVVVETWAPPRDDWAALEQLGRRALRWPR